MQNMIKTKLFNSDMYMSDCVVRSDSGRVLLSVSNLKMNEGTTLGIYGPSGAGKTTLLYSLAGLLDYVEGSIVWGKTDLLKLTIAQRSQFRADHVGIIFQDFHLFDELGALTNASISKMYSPRSERRSLTEGAKVILGHLGLNGANTSVTKLSGGERQRIAIARALAQEKSILLADEPTASLNREMADSLINDLLRYVTNEHKTLITVSHDINLLSRMDRTIELVGGHITTSTKVKVL